MVAAWETFAGSVQVFEVWPEQFVEDLGPR